MHLHRAVFQLCAGPGHDQRRPAGATSVLLQYMYQQAFTNANYGYAMAIAVVTLTIAFLLSKLSDRLTKND